MRYGSGMFHGAVEIEVQDIRGEPAVWLKTPGESGSQITLFMTEQELINFKNSLVAGVDAYMAERYPR